MMIKKQSEAAFTLVEIILVIVVSSIIATAGVRMVIANNNLINFQKTIQAMETLRNKIIGDETVVQYGMRTDFGYVGKYGSFPAALSDLAAVWPSSNAYIREYDAWGRRYAYTTSSGSYFITSYGADGNAGGTSINTDISMEIKGAHYLQNDIYIQCKDVNGTLLFAVDSGNQNFHIWRLQFIENVGTTYEYTSTGTATLGYHPSGYWYQTGSVKAGVCRIIVYPADGNGAHNSTVNRAAELCPGLSSVEVHDVVYPKGSFSQNKKNVYVVRFSGAVGTL